MHLNMYNYLSTVVLTIIYLNKIIYGQINMYIYIVALTTVTLSSKSIDH